MNFDFSEDQNFLRDEARKFLRSECSIEAVRSVLDSETATYHEELWNKIVELGWLGAAIPEEYGGLGLGPLEVCVLAEEIGRTLAPTPFSSSVYYAATAILQHGDKDLKQAWLPKIASGDAVGCYAYSEGASDKDVGALACEIQGQKLTGAKLPVPDGGVADFAIVLAKDGGSASWVLVDLKQATVSREALPILDPSRGYYKLVFDGAECVRIGNAGDGHALHADLMDRVAVYMAFEQLGGASHCLEMACDYAKERYAFGRPIGGNQAIKHRLADVWTKNEVARSNAYYGAWALSTNAPELAEAAAAARLAAIEANWFASKENIQVHGGMGYTWEVDCHLYYRRAKLLALEIGSRRVWKRKLIERITTHNVN